MSICAPQVAACGATLFADVGVLAPATGAKGPGSSSPVAPSLPAPAPAAPAALPGRPALAKAGAVKRKGRRKKKGGGGGAKAAAPVAGEDGTPADGGGGGGGAADRLAADAHLLGPERRGDPVVDGHSWLVGTYDERRHWFFLEYKVRGIGANATSFGPKTVPHAGCEPQTEQLKRFSRAQAAQCLKGKRGIFIGDSFMVETFDGMTDILLGTKEKLSFHSVKHHTVQRVARKRNAMFKNDTDIDLFCDTHKMVVLEQAVAPGDKHPPVQTLLEQDIEKYKGYDFIYLSSIIHNMKQSVLSKRYKCREDALKEQYREALDRLFAYVKEQGLKVFWVTGNGVNMKHTNVAYKAYQYNKRMLEYEALAVNAALRAGIPFLDQWHLPLGCKGAHCMEGHRRWKSRRTPDGIHYSRDVTRMKGQLLLNYLCPGMGDPVLYAPKADRKPCDAFLAPGVQPWSYPKVGRCRKG